MTERRRRNLPLAPLLILLFVIHELYQENQSCFTEYAKKAPNQQISDGSVAPGSPAGATHHPHHPQPSSSAADAETKRAMRAEIMMEFTDLTDPGSNQDRAFVPDPLFANLYKAFDEEESEEARCKRYGFDYVYQKRPKRKRIFFGALVADETKAVFEMHATEVYGIYHTVAFVESNRTFMDTQREFRLQPGMVMHDYVTSGIFGPRTNVFVDSWDERLPEDHAKGFTREQLQREIIVKRWKQEGMTSGDIGIVSDVDEFFTRDFLRAAQTCIGIKEFDLQEPITCHRPKVVGHTIMFEGTPYCRKVLGWFHPDMMIGACIEGIGNPTNRIQPVRDYHESRGQRVSGYGYRGPDDYRDEHKSLGNYPLWRADDFRSVSGGKQYNYVNAKDYLIGKELLPGFQPEFGTAFHVHNWFEDFKTLRHKYETYSHPADMDLNKFPLSKMNEDVDLMVRCVHNLPNEEHHFPNVDTGDDGYLIHERTLDEILGPMPIYFMNGTYNQERHDFLKKLVIEDEAIHASAYNQSYIRHAAKDRSRYQSSCKRFQYLNGSTSCAERR